MIDRDAHLASPATRQLHGDLLDLPGEGSP
jgi:hypothetical protein